MIIAAIPARSGSKGIPDKNIQHLGGKPLLAWSVETALALQDITNQVLVSTDSGDYADIASRYGAKVILRPPETAQDDSTDFDWINHLIRRMGWGRNTSSFLVNLRPTTPLRDPQVILHALEYFKAYNAINQHASATSLRSVEEMGESSFKSALINPNGCLEPISEYFFTLNIPPLFGNLSPTFTWEDPRPFRADLDFNAPRQQYPKTYHPNGYVDIIRIKHVLEKGELYGDKILAFETPRTVEIDTPEDLEFARWKVEHGD